MKHFTSWEAKNFDAYITERNLISPQNQISRSFTEGISGNAYADSSSTAVIAGDFVELSGPFDKGIYRKITEREEAHLVDPPESWINGIEKQYDGKISEYSRISFHPMSPVDASEKAAASADGQGLLIEGRPVEIRAIDDGMIPALYREKWSAELVSNTMMGQGKFWKIRLKVATRSGSKLPGIPDESCPPFRFKVATF